LALAIAPPLNSVAAFRPNTLKMKARTYSPFTNPEAVMVVESSPTSFVFDKLAFTPFVVTGASGAGVVKVTHFSTPPCLKQTVVALAGTPYPTIIEQTTAPIRLFFIGCSFLIWMY
jgi:hypothetical protein